MSLPDFITWFLDPAHYDHPVDRVELVQTHISYVLLAGDFVYKFKKPVNFGFLDFTTLDKRHHYCQQELLLNRRLCPDIYLDVFSVFRQGAGFTFGGTDEPVDYGVRMKMMPQERMMGRMIERGELSTSHINDIVATLVPFYKRAAGGGEIASFGTAQAVGVNVLENFDQTRGFIGKGALEQSQFDAISSYARAFLHNESLFLERSANRVKDCHGDLYSANICLADKVYIFDCIEFNERFRYCDVASDVAFLAMDLDFHGLKTLSDFFIDRFVAASGDTGLLAVLPFYKCYRAYVRGKIGLFTAHAPEVDERTRNSALVQAEKYFLLAEKYAG
ncbi:MAG: hypothetical protein KKC76_04010 [Proteobacteria bacterium]|nr:hypothetical protein [Pseudomonadota bacterium]MBU4296380.1 hypothetical protein [Pseudomonadota bacterium]MCG2750064.1 hypothetical protein [Desulfobulbaceae bacterium]